MTKNFILYVMGSIFKNARKNAGLDINDIAKALKIRREYLVAIENDEHSVIPAQVYVDGYKKIYANYLGLDLDKVLYQKKNTKRIAQNSKSLFKEKYLNRFFLPGSFIFVFLMVYSVQYLIDGSPSSLVDHLSNPENYESSNVSFRYIKEYDLENIESQ